MDKNYIKTKYMDSLTEEEQHMISVFSVICIEGVSVDVLCNVLKPDNPREFNTLVEKLSVWNWLFSDHQTVYCDQQIAAAVLEVKAIKTDSIEKILNVLRERLALQPLDDMISRQEYFVVARLFLTYMMKQWKVSYADNYQLIPLLSDVIIAFSTNVELSSFGNKRQPVYNLEDRIDFRLLDFLKGLDGSSSEGMVFCLLGELYTSIFRYEEAKECFQKAETYLGEDSNLLFAQALMYENLGIQGKAFQFTYRAYLKNKEYWNYEENIKVCLYMAYLCGVCESLDNCKYWRNIARSLMEDMAIPAGHIFSITLKEIEALLHLDNKALAFQILDSAELDVYKLYGGDAPEMARISYIRSLVDGEVGHLRKSNEYYRHYVNINHLNYGYSVGDTAVLYSAIINDNVIRGNNNTADIFAIKMQDLYAEGANIAPGVRLSQAFANCASNLADECYELSEAYLEVAQKIYEDELKPDEDTLSEIAPVFHDGVIPKSVLMTEENRIIKIVTINICLENGRIDEAKQLIKESAEKEGDILERHKWDIHMGRALIKEGRLDDGLEIWKQTISSVPNANKFEVAKEIAEWARTYDLIYDAMGFYEEALRAETMVYGKTCEIAEALQCYADVLELCGLKGKSEEPWKQAILLMRSMGDNDGIALLYFSWGASKQDYEAECLLKKAIDLWEPEHYVYDETLSKMYYYLCCAQAMQGKSEDARHSARKAVSLYPIEFPINLVEDIEAYL